MDYPMPYTYALARNLIQDMNHHELISLILDIEDIVGDPAFTEWLIKEVNDL